MLIKLTKYYKNWTRNFETWVENLRISNKKKQQALQKKLKIKVC